jgi:ubiquinone/menaquinone biosynthesis C-methylase UbiE
VIGVDSAPEAVDLAARLSSHTEPDRLACLCADGHHLPFMDGSYDAAICISVLAFCERPNLVLAELRRLLRPGGRLLIANSDEDTRIINSRDQELGRRIMRGIADRARDPWIGRRLVYLLIANGFRLRQEAVITDVERVYTPGASGYTLAHAFRKHLLQTGVSAQDYEHWLADLEACGREGSYSYGVMTFVGLAER